MDRCHLTSPEVGQPITGEAQRLLFCVKWRTKNTRVFLLFRYIQSRVILCPSSSSISRSSRAPLHLGVLQVAALAACHRPDCSSQPSRTLPTTHSSLLPLKNIRKFCSISSSEQHMVPEHIVTVEALGSLHFTAEAEER